MKNLLLLILTVVMVSSCCEEESSKWEAVSLTVDATPIPIINGLSFSPNFTTTGKDLDYVLSLNEEDMSWSVSGDYTLFTEFEDESIPVVQKTFEGKSKSGSYTETDDGFLFDDSLYDIEINDMLWSRDDGSPITFLLSESGDELIQEQVFTNIKVESDMNAILNVTTTWKRK